MHDENDDGDEELVVAHDAEVRSCAVDPGGCSSHGLAEVRHGAVGSGGRSVFCSTEVDILADYCVRPIPVKAVPVH